MFASKSFFVNLSSYQLKQRLQSIFKKEKICVHLSNPRSLCAIENAKLFNSKLFQLKRKKIFLFSYFCPNMHASTQKPRRITE
ncbi:hypothetical protein DW888_16125 [Bacteroides nordii]|uniref:Uncharacterized protein n=1 Tax=Bacteroides nordii TaxID=291645 RepID=A0A413VIG8_9BACE|nr:hypothetical protein DW888_16125 [Bacteroides nordii]